MGIYKGGYILADISGTALSSTPQDLLPKELKEYLKQYVNSNENFVSEILSKPIELIVQLSTGQIVRIRFNLIIDDFTEIVSLIQYEETNYAISISNDLRINENKTTLVTA